MLDMLSTYSSYSKLLSPVFKVILQKHEAGVKLVGLGLVLGLVSGLLLGLVLGLVLGIVFGLVLGLVLGLVFGLLLGLGL